MVIGCGILITWWYIQSQSEIGAIMQTTVKSVQKRANNEIEYAFRIPLSIMHTTIGALYTNNIAIDNSIFNGDYYDIFSSFDSIDPTNSIFDVLIYNEKYNIGYGVYKINSALYEWQFNGTCLDNTREVKCNYVPKERPWYLQALTLNTSYHRKWTEMYKFASDDNYGLILLTFF